MRIRVRPRRSSGNALFEFLVLVPFVIALGLLVWNVRSFVAQRTELAREVYVIAEVIANHHDDLAAPFQNALGRLRARLERDGSSGALVAAVVGRGRQRHDGTACPETGWCPPMVLQTWPTNPNDATWPTDGTCRGGASLPAVNGHFGPGVPLLFNENADPDGDGPEPPPPEADWLSRDLTATEWWVVIDICFDPEPDEVDIFRWVLDLPQFRQRVAWPSFHPLDNCSWCR